MCVLAGLFFWFVSWHSWGHEIFCGDCEDSPHFGRNSINHLEAMQLLGHSGFDFLPETDLQKRPGLDMVMTVGLQLCALKLTDLRSHFGSSCLQGVVALCGVDWIFVLPDRTR